MRSVVILVALLVLPSAASAGETTATLAIKNMFCPTCPITVREAIAKVPGVRTVAVDFRKKLRGHIRRCHRDRRQTGCRVA